MGHHAAPCCMSVQSVASRCTLGATLVCPNVGTHVPARLRARVSCCVSAACIVRRGPRITILNHDAGDVRASATRFACFLPGPYERPVFCGFKFKAASYIAQMRSTCGRQSCRPACAESPTNARTCRGRNPRCFRKASMAMILLLPAALALGDGSARTSIITS